MYNTYMSLHGIVMIFSILLGVGAMSNYLVPLMIGANDMAFPRLNAFAFWINVPAGILLLSSLALGGFDTGWTGYPPLSAKAPLGMQMFFLGVYLFGLSSILGSLNIIVTTMRLRTKGMNYFRMPIFVWSALATAIIGLTATQLIGLSFQMVMFERLFGMGFFNPESWRRPDPFPAPFLVLFASGGVRLCAYRFGCDQRTAACVRPQTALWLSLGRHVQPGHRPGRFPGLGAPHVYQRYGSLSAGAVYVQHPAGGCAHRGEIL